MIISTILLVLSLAVLSVIPSFLIGGVLVLMHKSMNSQQEKAIRNTYRRFAFVHDLLEDGAYLIEGMAQKRGEGLIKIASALRLYNFVIGILLACVVAGTVSYDMISKFAKSSGPAPYVIGLVCAVVTGVKCVELLLKSRTYLALRYAKGRVIDWDDKTVVHGIEILARFDQRPHQVPFTLQNGAQRVSSDSITYKVAHIAAKPDIIHRHFNCNLVIEFKSLSGSNTTVTPENWKSVIRFKDVLQLLASAAAVSRYYRNAPVGALLLYPGVTLFIRPMQDQVQWLFNFAYQKSKEQNVALTSASELAQAAEGSFVQHFTDASVRGISAHESLINAPVIRL